VEAVTNSAIAGQAMSELAATLPNTGGAVAFFAGDNDLATFGEQLVSFGASIKSYAQEVTGLDTDAVASSTVAGQTLVELANTLPNTGGLVAFFTGDNDLETFGEQLVPFGEAMKAYSDSVTGMDSAAVTASATAAKALAELQASLPNIGGVVDFCTGGNDLVVNDHKTVCADLFTAEDAVFGLLGACIFLRQEILACGSSSVNGDLTDIRRAD